MKLRRLSLAVCLISLASLAGVTGRTRPRQRVAGQHIPPYRVPVRRGPYEPAGQSDRVQLDLTYDFSVPGNTSRIKFVVLVPKTIPGRQQISIDYSPQPSKLYYKNGNRYAEFNFRKPRKRFKVKIGIDAAISRYDLSTARKKPAEATSEDGDLDEFLKHEELTEKNHPSIQQIAEEITGQTRTDIVRKIYEHVIDNLEYAGYTEEDLGALEAVRKKKGDCSEYASLLVALCRAREIPARIVYGYTAQFKDTAKHGWAEVYFQDYGWVPFDPTRGDSPNRFARNRAFHTLDKVYVYLSRIRNDDVIGDLHYYKYWHWGDKVKVKTSVKRRQDNEPVRRTR